MRLCTYISILFWWGLIATNASAQSKVEVLPLEKKLLQECDSLFQRLQNVTGARREPAAIEALADSLIQKGKEAASLKYIGLGLYKKGICLGNSDRREEALELMQSAIQCFEAVQDSEFIPKSYYSKGAMLLQMERLAEATLAIEKSIETSRMVQDTNGYMFSLNIMALIQRDLGNYQVAIDYLKEGMEVTGERGKYYLMQNLGIVYKEMEEYDLARECFQQVADFHERKGSPMSQAYALTNLATVSIREEDPETALVYLKQAEKTAPPSTPERFYAVLLSNSGSSKAMLGRCNEALPDLKRAREIYSRLGNRKKFAVAMGTEAECLFETGNYKLAFELMDSSKFIADSLADLNRTTAIADLEQKYRQKDQKQRIEDLEKENNLILERNKAYEESLRNQRLALFLLIAFLLLIAVLAFVLVRLQKVRFMQRTESERQQLLRQQIKPHFIFNALNSVQHFLLHDRKKEGLLYLGKLGKLLRLILTNSEEDLVSVKDELDLIRHYLEMEQVRTNHKFEFRIESESGVDTSSMYMPGMVLQVLAENAIWHGIAKRDEPGEIVVFFHCNREKTEIGVRDNGPGLQAKVKPREGHKSLGLELVKRRIQRVFWKRVSFSFSLEEINSEVGKVEGTVARISFIGNIHQN